MASLMPVAKQQYFDSNGVPLSGGKVYTYAAGTTSPLSTYSDKAGVTPNTNPVVLDSRGEATIFWGNAGYKVVLKDSADVTIWTQDNLYAVQDSSSMTFAQELITATAGQTVFNLSISYTNGTNSLAVFCNGLRLNSTDYTETSTTSVTLNTGATVGDEFLFVAGDFAASTTGADLVTYTPAGTGAVATTVQAKLRESVSVKDFGAVGDGVADDTAAVQAANTYCNTNKVTLEFPRPDSFYKITANITLTCDVSAGWYQIFDGASAYTVAGLREIRFEWWGAKGDAVAPAVTPPTLNPVTNIPTGTNDSVAIRKAVACAQATSMGWSGSSIGGGSTSQPYQGVKTWMYPCKVIGRPGAGYLCSGDNILGSQGTTFGSSSRFYFDGQGCSFEWLPSGATDAFINHLDVFAQPAYKNFSFHTWGFTGNKGYFVHCSDTILYENLLDGPLFENIIVDRGGYYYATTESTEATGGGNALTSVFYIEGTNYNAGFDISHCLFAGFLNFMTITNGNAVGMSVSDSQLFSWYTGAVFFQITGAWGGGLWLTNNIIEMLGSANTLIKTTTSATHIGEVHVKKCRMETRANDFVIVDAEAGQFYIDGLNPNYGNASTTNAKSCIVKKWTMAVVFTNCWCPQKTDVWVYPSADWTTYSGNFAAIEFNKCTFPSATPTFNWYRSDTLASVADFPALFSAFLALRTIRVINSNQGFNFVLGTETSESTEQKLRLGVHNKSDGKIYVDTSNMALPAGVVITSLLCVCEAANTAVTDRIRVTINTGGPVYDSLLSGATVTKNQLIPSTAKGVGIPGSANISATYNLAGAVSATKYSAYVEITYRAMQSNQDLNIASLTPVQI